MASSIFDWSTTAASNSNSDSGINWVEGQLPGTVNGSARAMMGRLAELVKDLGGALVAGGTANALTVTANSAFTTNANGRFLAFRAASDNSAAATLDVNSIGAKSIRKMTAGGDSALSGAEIQADGIYLVYYSEALNSASGGWLLLNPTIDLASLVTLTGTQTLTNKSLTSPALTGTPTTPTAAPGTNTTQISSTAFVTAAIAALSSVYQAASAVLTALAGIGTAVAGDLIYGSGAGTWGRLAKGTAFQVLRMNTGATAPEYADIGSTTATLSVGAIGTYALCNRTTSGALAPGATIAGSELQYTNVFGDATGNVPTGTWRAMGQIVVGGANIQQKSTLFMRIS